MMKKVLAFVLAVVMTVSLCPLSVFAEGETLFVYDDNTPIQGQQQEESAQNEPAEEPSQEQPAEEPALVPKMMMTTSSPSKGVPTYYVGVSVNLASKISQNELHSSIKGKYSACPDSFTLVSGSDSINVSKSSSTKVKVSDNTEYSLKNSSGSELAKVVIYTSKKIELVDDVTINRSDLTAGSIRAVVMNKLLTETTKLRLDAYGISDKVTVAYYPLSGDYKINITNISKLRQLATVLVPVDQTPSGEQHAFGAQKSETVVIYKLDDLIHGYTKVTIVNNTAIKYANPNASSITIKQHDSGYDYSGDIKNNLAVVNDSDVKIEGADAYLTLGTLPDMTEINKDYTVSAYFKQGDASYVDINNQRYLTSENKNIVVRLVEGCYTVKSGTIENATVKLNGEALAENGNEIAESSSLAVEVTPGDNYYVTSVTLKNADGSSAGEGVKNGNTYTFSGLVKDKTYTLNVTTKQYNIKLNGDVTIADDQIGTTEKLLQAIFDAAIDKTNSDIPSDFSYKDVTIEYKSGNTDTSWLVPGSATVLNEHKYKTDIGTSEKVRISFKGSKIGNDFTVTVKDHRIPTTLTLDPAVVNNTITLANPEATDAAARKQAYLDKLLAVLTLTNGSGAMDKSNITLSGLDDLNTSTTVGVWGKTYTVKASYKGDPTYQPSNEITLTVIFDDPRADSTLVVADGTFKENFYSFKFDNQTLDQLRTLVFNTVVDTTKTSAHITLTDDLVIEYKAGNNDSSWVALNDAGTSNGFHKFGSQSTENVRLMYKGTEQYKATDYQRATLTIEDTRKAPVITFTAEKPNFPFTKDEDYLAQNASGRAALLFESIVSSSEPAGLLKDGVLSSTISIKYNAGGLGTDHWQSLDYEKSITEAWQHVFGKEEEETVRIVFNGNEEYYGKTFDVTVTMQDSRTASSVVYNANPVVKYNFFNGDGFLGNDKYQKVFDAVVDVSQSSANLQQLDKNVIIEYYILSEDLSTVQTKFLGSSIGSAIGSLFGDALDEYLNLDSDIWKPLNYEASGKYKSVFDTHVFGTNETEMVRIRFRGSQTYQPIARKDATSVILSFEDTRTPVEVKLQDTKQYDYYVGMHNNVELKTIEGNVFKSIVASSTPKMTKDNGTLKDNVTIEYYVPNKSSEELESFVAGLNLTEDLYENVWQPLDYNGAALELLGATHKFGENSTERIRIKRDGDANYQKFSEIYEVTIHDPREEPTLVANTLAEGATEAYLFDNHIGKLVPGEGGTTEYVLDYHEGKEIDPLTVFTILVKNTEPAMVENGELTEEVKVEYYALEYQAGGVTQLVTDGWKPLDYAAGDSISEQLTHKFGANTTERIRISFAGVEDKNLSKYKEASWEFTMKLEDLRQETYMKTFDDVVAFTVYQGSDICGTLADSILVYNKSNDVLLNIDGETELAFTPDPNDLGVSEGTSITVTYVGDNDYKPCSKEVSVTVVEAEHTYKVKLEVTTASDKDKVSLIPSFQLEDDVANGVYSVEGHSGFKVVATPDKNNKTGKAFSNYTYSIVITTTNEQEETVTIASSGETVDCLKVDAETLMEALGYEDVGEEGAEDKVIVGECTVSVIFKKVELAVNDGAAVPYHKIRITDKTTGEEVYNPAFTQMLFDAVYDSANSKPGNLTLDNSNVTVEYYALNTSLRQSASGIGSSYIWMPLDFDGEISDDTQILNLLGSYAYHKFGENGCDSTETVRIGFKIGGNTIYKEATVNLADLRTPTIISCEDVTSFYNQMRTTILSKIQINEYVDGNVGEAVEFLDEEIVLSEYSADLKDTQVITVSFTGNSDYKPSECQINAYVLYGIATMYVSNTVINFDPDRDREETNEIKDSMITVDPENIDYVTIINGVDASIDGFVSIGFPKSLRERMSVDLLKTLGIDSEIAKKLLGDATTIDFYDLLAEQMGTEGVSLPSLKTIFADLSEKMSEEVPTMGGTTYAELINFNLDTFNSIIKILELIPSIEETKITLENAPRNAGLYTVNAISVDADYLPAFGVGILTILPVTENLALQFTESEYVTQATLLGSPVDGVYQVQYDKFADPAFESACGAVLFWNEEMVNPDDVEFVYTYTGVSDGLSLTAFDHKDKPTKSGIYIQTISTIGNYIATPITRTIRVLPSEVVIEADSPQTFEYGQPYTLRYTVEYKDMDLAVPAEDVTVTYKQVSTGFFSGLKKLFTASTTTAPTEVGTYEATIVYSGDSSNKKVVTVVIQEAPKTVAGSNVAKTTLSSLSKRSK